MAETVSKDAGSDDSNRKPSGAKKLPGTTGTPGKKYKSPAIQPPTTPPGSATKTAGITPAAPSAALEKPEETGAEYLDEALHLEQPEAAQPEDEAEKRARWRATSASRKLAKKEAQQSAIILLSLVDGLASMAFGASCSMNEFERVTLQEPLERILQRIDLTSSEALAKWSDPILLTMGLVAWASRVMRERAENNPKSNPGGDNKPPEPQPPVKPDNGRVEEILLTEQMRPPAEIAHGIRGTTIEQR